MKIELNIPEVIAADLVNIIREHKCETPGCMLSSVDLLVVGMLAEELIKLQRDEMTNRVLDHMINNQSLSQLIDSIEGNGLEKSRKEIKKMVTEKRNQYAAAIAEMFGLKMPESPVTH